MDYTDKFTKLRDLVLELRSDNSTTHKRKTLSQVKDPGLTEILRLTYDTDQMFFLTLDKVGKDESEEDSIWEEEIEEWPANTDPLSVFTLLSTRSVTGDAAVGLYKSARKALPEDLREYFDLILERDLKSKVSMGILSEAFPDMFSEFSVQLAEKYERKRLTTPILYLSRKLDGVRMILTYIDGVATAFSRTGKRFETVGVVLSDFSKHLAPAFVSENFVLDGELCLIDNTGQEDFQGIVSMFRRKDFTIPNPRYVVFDIIPYKDFVMGKGDQLYSERWNRVGALFAQSQFQNIRPVDTWTATHQDIDENLKTWLKDGISKGWEGLMVRNNTPYEGKRSFNLLKVKAMQDAEFLVLRTTNGMVDNGVGKKVEALSSVTIKLDDSGNEVEVGSGFKFADRQLFFTNPEQIIGETITVQFFERTTDQFGKPSLRFPVYLGIRDYE